MRESYSEKPKDLWIEAFEDRTGSECFVHINDNITEESGENGENVFSADHYVIKAIYRPGLDESVKNNRSAWIERAIKSKDIVKEKTETEKKVEQIGSVMSAMLGSDADGENQEISAMQMNRFFQLQVQAANLSDEQAMEVSDLYEEWQPGKKYPADKIIKWGKNADGETQLYRVLQEHTSQSGWEPNKAPSLFKAIGYTEEGTPIWTQPLGGHDAYKKGDEVSHNGKIWVSDLDGNVWEPGVIGWTEKETKKRQ